MCIKTRGVVLFQCKRRAAARVVVMATAAAETAAKASVAGINRWPRKEPLF